MATDRDRLISRLYDDFSEAARRFPHLHFAVATQYDDANYGWPHFPRRDGGDSLGLTDDTWRELQGKRQGEFFAHLSYHWLEFHSRLWNGTLFNGGKWDHADSNYSEDRNRYLTEARKTFEQLAERAIADFGIPDDVGLEHLPRKQGPVDRWLEVVCGLLLDPSDDRRNSVNYKRLPGDIFTASLRAIDKLREAEHAQTSRGDNAPFPDWLSRLDDGEQRPSTLEMTEGRLSDLHIAYRSLDNYGPKQAPIPQRILGRPDFFTLTYFANKRFGGTEFSYSVLGQILRWLQAEHGIQSGAALEMKIEDVAEMLRSDSLASTSKPAPPSEQAEARKPEGGGRASAEEPSWFTVTEAASASGARKDEITRAADAGKLQTNGVKGHKRRIDPASLSRWQLERANRPERQEDDAKVRRNLNRGSAD